MAETISVIMEGGVGDFLSAVRFIPAIKESHPDSELKLFNNSKDGTLTQANLITKLFPSYFESVTQVKRASQQYKIKSQFGVETYNGDYLNIEEKDRTEIERGDHVYNLHVDSLKFLHEIKNWHQYFYTFPKADISKIDDSILKEVPEDFLLCHLFSRPDSDHNLNQMYVRNLLANISMKYPVVVIVENKYKDFYSGFFPNVTFVDPTLEQCFLLAQKCKAFLGIDSGIRYMPLFSRTNTPTFCFSNFAKEVGKAAPSHVLRWLIHEKWCLPMHLEIDRVCQIIDNSLRHPAGLMYPDFNGVYENMIVERIKAK